MTAKGKMRAAVYEGPYRVGMVSHEIPVPKAGEALIKVKYAGICGSDMLIYHGKHPLGTEGVIMGHEFTGEIVELGPQNNSEVQKGDRVAIEPLITCGRCAPCLSGNYNVCKKLGLYGISDHGGLAEYITVPVQNLHVLPDNVDLKRAALLEPLSAAVHIVGRSRVRLGVNALVLGGGPIGYLVAQVCKAAGATFVGVSEVDPFRLAKLREAGVEAIDATEGSLEETIMQKTEGEGVDVLFEVAGVSQTLKQATSITNVHGQIVIVALLDKPVPFDLVAIMFKEYEIIGSRTYTARDYKTAIKLLEQERVAVDPLITHELSLEEAAHGFELVSEGRQVMKVLIKP